MRDIALLFMERMVALEYRFGGSSERCDDMNVKLEAFMARVRREIRRREEVVRMKIGRVNVIMMMMME